MPPPNDKSPELRKKSTAAKGTLGALKLAPALTVPETITVADISQLCAAKRSDCVLVVDDEGDITGIVTAKILAHRVIAEGLEPRATLARQIMRRDPTVALDTSSAAHALELMVAQKFRYLTVCSEDGSIVGVLDIAKIFYEMLSHAQRRSSASEMLFNAMAGVKAELGVNGSNSDMLVWAERLRDKTALPDLSSVMGSRTQPAIVSPKITVREAAQLMKEKGTSAVCVVEETGPASPPGSVRPRIVGIFTSKDIVLRVIAAGVESLRCSVVRVMTPHPETAHPTATIYETVKRMHDGGYLNVPIVEEDGRLIAIVDVLTLAEATQEQIRAANHDVQPPAPEVMPGPMWDRFFDAIREISPVQAATGSPPISPEPMQQVSSQSDASSIMGSGAFSAWEGDISMQQEVSGQSDASSILGSGAFSAWEGEPMGRQMSAQSDASSGSGAFSAWEGEPMGRQMSAQSSASSMSSGAFSAWEGEPMERQMSARSNASSMMSSGAFSAWEGEPMERQRSVRSDASSMMGSGAFSAWESDTFAVHSTFSSTEGETFLFKFRAPSGMIHRFKARYNDNKQLREMIVAKLETDLLFNPESYTEPTHRPDPNDFILSYEDEDGDNVIITSDYDVMEAVESSRKVGRVMLLVTGGKSWAKAKASAGECEEETKPVLVSDEVRLTEVAVAAVSEEKSHDLSPPAPVPALAPTSDRVDLVRDQHAPLEYTPPSYEHDVSSPSSFSQSDMMENDNDAAPTHNEQDEIKKGASDGLPPLHASLYVTDEINTLPEGKLLLVEDEDLLKEDSKSEMGQEDVKGGQPTEEDTATDNVKALVARLTSVLEDVVQYRRLLSCHNMDAQKLLDMFQTLLDTPGLTAKFRRNLLVATQRLSRRAGLYPTCYNLGDIELESEYPFAAGGFADIYKGRFRGQVVCLKVIRIYQTSQMQMFLKQFSAEAILWGQLSHINLLPIYGLYRYDGRLCLVAPWMERGDIITFLEKQPSANRALLVLDIASGVSYLHGNDIIHGDLKGANILVNSSGHACLADFGLSAVSDTNILHWASNSSAGSKGGSTRWQAPELFDVETDEVVFNTKASDVYAYACVAYEIFTGNIPFHELGRDTTVMLKVKAGIQPSRPPSSSLAWGPWGLTEAVWSLMEACWSADLTQRPNIDDIIAQHSLIILVDDRQLESQDVISPAHFRDSVGGRPDLLPVVDVETILSGVESEAETPVLA